jgi:hypothetical protein
MTGAKGLGKKKSIIGVGKEIDGIIIDADTEGVRLRDMSITMENVTPLNRIRVNSAVGIVNFSDRNFHHIGKMGGFAFSRPTEQRNRVIRCIIQGQEAYLLVEEELDFLFGWRSARIDREECVLKGETAAIVRGSFVVDGEQSVEVVV